MKVLILTEASKKIGTGHILRCLALLEAFEINNIDVKIITNIEPIIELLLSGKNYEMIDWINNKKNLESLINKTHIVIIDSYKLETKYYQLISELSNFSVYIDDNNRVKYPKGIVLNYTPYANELNFQKRPDVHYLLGFQYNLLRKPFWKNSKFIVNNEIEEILITMGGSDINKITSKLINGLANKFKNIKFNVIVGIAADDINYSRNIKNIKILKNISANEMKNYMMKSDLVISSSGQTLLELFALGIPTIALVLAENQRQNCNYFVKINFIDKLNNWNDNNLIENIEEQIKINNYSNRYTKNKISFLNFHGIGPLNVVEKIKIYYCNSNSIFEKHI